MMENSKTQNLAEKIALLLQEKESEDAVFFRESLEKINRRLENIESQINSEAQRSSQNAKPAASHPSQEKFLNIEAIADEIIGNLKNEKACPYEPAGKPCDNCAMCNSRGF